MHGIGCGKLPSGLCTCDGFERLDGASESPSPLAGPPEQERDL